MHYLMPYGTKLFQVCILLLSIFLHINRGDAMEVPNYTLDPPEFLEVMNMCPQIYPVSPKRPYVPGGWLGAIISAPNKVSVQIKEGADHKHLQIPLPFCTFYLLGLPDIRSMHAMELHLINKKSGTEYHGKVYSKLGGISLPLAGLPYNSHPEDYAGGYISYHINEYVDLPMESAIYSFWTVVGETKSNTVQIEIEVIQE